MAIEAITLAEFERLRPPTDDDHFWFRHYALGWDASATRESIAAVYQSASRFSYVVFTRDDDALYRGTSTGSGMIDLDNAVRVLAVSMDRDG